MIANRHLPGLLARQVPQAFPVLHRYQAKPLLMEMWFADTQMALSKHTDLEVAAPVIRNRNNAYIKGLI